MAHDQDSTCRSGSEIEPASDAIHDEIGPALDPLATLRALEQSLASALSANPLESLTVLVAGSAALLYWAESGKNEKIRTYWDAVNYVATSLSVGYANIFPETQFGKALGALVMMIGPALSSRALQPADPPAAAPCADTDRLVAKLDEILVELRRLGSER